MTHRYDSSGWRPDLTALKVIDIGGACSFASGYLDAVIDIRPQQSKSKHCFTGNIDFPEVWEEVKTHATLNGKWDYAICTHTLEDINNPLLATQNIEKIAKRGLIVVPSKYRELSRFSGTFRGYIHHRWIFDVRGGKLIALPKINFIEDSFFDPMADQLPGKEELIVEWEGKIGMEYLNEGMPYGTAELSGEEHIKHLYKELCN